MSVVSKLKSVFGMESEQHPYRCLDCGAEFESHISPETALNSCPECDSRDVEVRVE